MTRLLHQLTVRARDERGMALVMAIGVSFVLAVLGATVIVYTTSNEKDANRVNARTKAYQIAQAGVDSAASQLGALASSDANLYSATFFSSKPAADRTTTIDNGTVTWNGVLNNDSPVSIPKYRWRITSTATVPNPAGGAAISKTITADIKLNPEYWQTPNTDVWKYIYSRANDNDPNTCDQTIQNNPAITSSFYVNGDLCLDNSSNIYGPSTGEPDVEIVVHGRSYLNHPSTSIGTSARPVTKVWSTLGCKYRTQAVGTPCTSIDKVWPDSYSPTDTTHPIPVVVAPTALYSDWYHLASPGPANSCGGGSFGPVPAFETPGQYSVLDTTSLNADRSVGTQDLAPASSYACNTRTGWIRWDFPTKTLTIFGTIYIDGNVDFSSDGVINYNGPGAIYTTGSVRIRQTILCAQVNSAGDGCDSAWTNSDSDVLVFVTKGTGTPALSGAGVTFEQSAAFQGALYSAGNMTFENNTWVQGPMIAEREIINNSMFFHYIPTLVNVPFGAPGTTSWRYTLGPAQHYIGG
jgi:Tfp pilus assembly protein PilX